ncbi:MAG TPA: hypothetical protein PLH57_00940 [Oligoflexia bacterium]|nr:hypothetical protein [Oligoflexia bacterium]
MRVWQSFQWPKFPSYLLPGSLMRLSLVAAFIWLTTPAFAIDCSRCFDLLAEARGVEAETTRTNDLLESNKRALASINPRDVSKKVKISSNILVLSTRVETMANKRQILEQQLVQAACNGCPRPASVQNPNNN